MRSLSEALHNSSKVFVQFIHFTSWSVNRVLLLPLTVFATVETFVVSLSPVLRCIAQNEDT